MGMPRIPRRWFLRTAFYSVPVVCAADAFWIEPEWLKVRKVKMSEDPTTRFVHFTDLHHKGDRGYLTKVIDRINALSPDFVCFTGDIVENKSFLAEALDGLSELKPPTYGVPGNWDYIARGSQSEIGACFKSTGGAWMRNTDVQIGDLNITGNDNRIPQSEPAVGARKRILLTHFPTDADKVLGEPFDLILAGHSHGGQCRVPFFGALVVPDRVGSYSRGRFQTSGGPLYVNPGIGTFLLSVRFACRPEITVIEI